MQALAARRNLVVRSDEGEERPEERKGEFSIGDVWTWTAIDADTTLVPSFLIGTRDGEAAARFVCDLSRRLANRVQVTSDGHRAYLEAVEAACGADVGYAQLIKMYGTPVEGQKRYSPAKLSKRSAATTAVMAG